MQARLLDAGLPPVGSFPVPGSVALITRLVGQVSENASRLAAMERADRHIGGLLTDLNAKFHRTRQGGIDEGLFDVIAGFDAMKPHR